LGDRQLADQVDFELAAKVVERLQLERRRHDDPRVVDESGEAMRGYGTLDGLQPQPRSIRCR